MRDIFNKFMQGRYGVDAFARFTMGVALVAIIISIFFPGGNRIGALFDTIGLLVLLYTYYRMLSRDIQKRYAENEKYLAATAKFTPKEANGEVKVSFTFDASKLGGYSLVAFEKMLDVETGAVIGTHEDITDKDQTVKVKGVKKTPKTTSHTSTPGSGSSSSSVKTGQKSIVPVVIGLIVVVVAGGTAFVIRKKQKGDEEQ